MKFRDIINKQIEEASDVCPICGQTPCNCTSISESEMKFQALAKAKELHTALATITFIEMMSLMSTDNPAKKEVQALETKLNDLTTEVGEFIQKYIPDVADADPGDTEEYAEPEEADEEQQKEAKK
jgi:DNA repair exonuclease SbcCD ATPase subunit